VLLRSHADARNDPALWKVVTPRDADQQSLLLLRARFSSASKTTHRDDSLPCLFAARKKKPASGKEGKYLSVGWFVF
jgi:hypothetical protein